MALKMVSRGHRSLGSTASASVTAGQLRKWMSSVSSELVTCQLLESGGGSSSTVAKVTFNAPDRLNALTVAMAEEFSHKLRQDLINGYVVSF